MDPQSHRGRNPPSQLGTNDTFEESAKAAVLDQPGEFIDSATLLQGLRDSEIAPWKTPLLIIEAVTALANSSSSAKSITKHFKGLISFYLDTRNESAVTLTGDGPLVLLRDYLESLKERGRTAPAAARHALTVWSDALGVEWPLARPLVVSAATVEGNEDPTQEPAMDIDTIRKLENTATNVDVALNKRAFADGILLMTYASLRFADVRMMRSFEINEESIHGALLTSETKKHHGRHCPWGWAMMGIANRTNWTQPLLDLRQAYLEVNGAPTQYAFRRLGHTWGLVSEDPAAYRTTSRKLALICVGIGDAKGESYTLHSPKTLSPTATNQMSFDQRRLTIIGHWSSASRIPGRYDRGVCANELLLRNTIAQKMAAGRALAPAYHLPSTVTGHFRIGKEPETHRPPECALTQPALGSDDPPHTDIVANHDMETQQTIAIGDDQAGGELSHTPLAQDSQN